MIFRRILIISFLSFVLLWLFFFWFISLAGPTYLTQKAAAKGYDLSIEKIHTNYLHKITLHNIKFKKPVEGFISRARFSFRPWEFFRTGQFFFLDLKEPRIQMTSPMVISQDGSVAPFLFRLRIRANQGQLATTIAKKQILITNASGHADLGPLGVFGRFSGSPNDAGAVTLNFSFPSILKSWRAHLTSDTLSVERLVDGFIASNSALHGLIDGIGKVAVDAEINSEKISVKSVKLRNGMILTGLVNSWKKKPVLDLKLSAPNTSLQDLVSIFLPRSSNSLVGDISLETKIQGAPSHPLLSGTFLTQGQFGNVRMPELKGEFSYQN